MNTPDSHPTDTRAKNRKARLFVISFPLGVWMACAPKYLGRVEGPAWLRIGLLLLPWLVLGVALTQRRWLWNEDELEVLINRRALAFAFFVTFFGSMALAHLQAAGYVPDFTWTNQQLVGALALVLIAGLVLTKLRYR